MGLVRETGQHCLLENGVCMISDHPKWMQHLALTALLCSENKQTVDHLGRLSIYMDEQHYFKRCQSLKNHL